MASYQELKTRVGVKRFLLHPQNGSEEYILAFEYLDGKSEAHLVKRECAPLYFDEPTAITLISSEQISPTLVAITSSVKSNSGTPILFRCWDANSTLGFTQKEIQVQDVDGNTPSDGKFRCFIPNDAPSETANLLCDNMNGYFAVRFKPSSVYLWRVTKTDASVVLFEFLSVIFTKSQVESICFLKYNDVTRILLCEANGISLWKIDSNTGSCSIQKTIAVPTLSKGHVSGVSALQRVGSSSCIIAFKDQTIYTFITATSTLTRCFQGSISGEFCMMSVMPNREKTGGTLAVSYDGFTINLYSLSSILSDAAKKNSTLRRPSKVLFSRLMLDALVFAGSETLVGSSISNRTLLFWGGLKE